MLSNGILTASYIVAAVLFIFSIEGLSDYKKLRKRNNYAIIGMLIALILTILNLYNSNIELIVIAVIIGSIIGIFLAKKIDIIQLPRIILILYSFISLSILLICFNSFIEINKNNSLAINYIYLIKIFFGIFISSVIFISSIMTYSRLFGKLSSKPVYLKDKYKINLLILVGTIFLFSVFILIKNFILQVFALLFFIIIALIIGYRFIISISKFYTPVIVLMLNSCLGWLISLIGFILYNNLLIITGSIVGFSGLILSYKVCEIINCSFFSIIKSGFIIRDSLLNKEKEDYKHNKITSKQVAELLKNSTSVIITPGYGLIASKAQDSIFYIIKKLYEFGINVRFAVHPIAGRLLGHMNIFLAESKIFCNIMTDLNEINTNLSSTDTVLVIGANDIVNFNVKNNSDTQIFSMKVLEVWKANNVVVFKRSTNTGYFNIENSLFLKENTKILFGDAKDSLDSILYFLNK